MFNRLFRCSCFVEGRRRPPTPRNKTLNTEAEVMSVSCRIHWLCERLCYYVWCDQAKKGRKNYCDGGWWAFETIGHVNVIIRTVGCIQPILCKQEGRVVKKAPPPHPRDCGWFMHQLRMLSSCGWQGKKSLFRFTCIHRYVSPFVLSHFRPYVYIQ